MSASFFSLLQLPAEIRNLIYSFIILPRHEHLEAQPENSKFFSDLKTNIKFSEPAPISSLAPYFENRRLCHIAAQSLLAVCKQTYYETSPVFYRNKTLVLTKPHESAKRKCRTPNYRQEVDGSWVNTWEKSLGALECLRTIPLELITHLEFSVTFPEWCLVEYRRLYLPRLETLQFKCWQCCGQQTSTNGKPAKLNFSLPDLQTTFLGSSAFASYPRQPAVGRIADMDLDPEAVEEGNLVLEDEDEYEAEDLTKFWRRCARNAAVLVMPWHFTYSDSF